MCTIITLHTIHSIKSLLLQTSREEKFKFFFADISRRSKHGRLVKNNLKIISTKKRENYLEGGER